MLAEVQRERARVDAVDAGDAVRAEVFVEALFAAPVAGLCQIAYHQSGQKKGAAFSVRAVDSVVADFGGGEGDELSGVGRVGQYLLISAHAGVEHDFAQRVLFRAERDAVEDRSIVQRKERRPFALRFPFLLVVHLICSILVRSFIPLAQVVLDRLVENLVSAWRRVVAGEIPVANGT